MAPPPDEPDFDAADTGPLHLPATPPEDEDGWNSGPETSPSTGSDWETNPSIPQVAHEDPSRAPTSETTWADRFEAPLSVTPRTIPARVGPNPKILFGVLGAVAVVALSGGLVFWLTRPPSNEGADSPSAEPSTSVQSEPSTTPVNEEDKARLMRLLPRGYPPDSCQSADISKGALAQVDCGQNTDQDGPVTGIYTLASDKAALDAAFTDSIATTQQVNCPGNIQSPGPWRRNATPQTVSGTLFCGLRDGQPTVVWTDDAKLTLNAVRSGPQGLAFPALYAWWSSHS